MRSRGIFGGTAVVLVLVALLVCGGAAFAKDKQQADSGRHRYDRNCFHKRVIPIVSQDFNHNRTDNQKNSPPAPLRLGWKITASIPEKKERE